MTRMTGPDCAAMYNLVNNTEYTHTNRHARNSSRFKGVTWETGETRAEGERNGDKKVLVQCTSIKKT